eukprot:4870956-Pyramimonas_sp.AAC.1
MGGGGASGVDWSVKGELAATYHGSSVFLFDTNRPAEAGVVQTEVRLPRKQRRNRPPQLRIHPLLR